MIVCAQGHSPTADQAGACRTRQPVSPGAHERVRLLLVSNGIAAGGAEKYLQVLRAGAEAAGFEVSVAHVRLPGKPDAQPFFDVPVAAQGVLVRRLLAHRYHRAAVPLIVHMNSCWSGNLLPALLAARLAGAKLVLTEHIVPPVAPPARSALRRFAPWRVRLKLRALRRRVEWKTAHRIILVGGLVGELLADEQGLYGEHAVVIPNGVKLSDFSPGSAHGPTIRRLHGIGETIVIGSCGRLSDQKRYDRLVEALAMLERPDVALLLVGEGPDRQMLEAEARRCGVAGRVHLVGQRENVSHYLSAMDIFALPSQHEAMPFSILEAMASHLPIVATDVGGVREMVRHGGTGYVVPAGDGQSLVEALRQLVDSAERRSQFGLAGRCLVEEAFSEEAMVRRTLAVYRELVACHR